MTQLSDGYLHFDKYNVRFVDGNFNIFTSMSLEEEVMWQITDLIDKASIISITDSNGKITYVNEQFVRISGWSEKELLGKDHKIVNSGVHPDEFWKQMYQTVLSGNVWNSVVTNKKKTGELYHVDTYIQGRFDERGQLQGFASIRQDVTQIVDSLNEVAKKNVYLEHAAKIIRHDMHSGINTYIPRGISSLERRLPCEVVKTYKLDMPMKLLKDGLKHAQKIYKGVYDFTNLVKVDSYLPKSEYDLKEILDNFLATTAYRDQVEIKQLCRLPVNESLFCTAIDNLVRNGLKYNDSEAKYVIIQMIDDQTIGVIDNGRGMTQQEFQRYSQPYVRNQAQKEKGTGLGLNICVAILNEHGFHVSCERLDGGSMIKVKIR